MKKKVPSSNKSRLSNIFLKLYFIFTGFIFLVFSFIVVPFGNILVVNNLKLQWWFSFFITILFFCSVIAVMERFKSWVFNSNASTITEDFKNEIEKKFFQENLIKFFVVYISSVYFFLLYEGIGIALLVQYYMYITDFYSSLVSKISKA
jgi:hypothetical protein